MNMNIISKYLQFLRKSNNYTQDDLAKELGISRQAVSKWETGMTIPGLEILLKISKLYGITINDILEPKIQLQRITAFEQISTISEKELKEVLEQFDTNSLVTALAGASPETNGFCERLFPDIDFEMARKNIGRIRVETVEDMQNQIISMVNLQAMEEK
jgi:transcriptional regulator with XRE-family HTH domain